MSEPDCGKKEELTDNSIYGVRKAVSYIFEYQISSAENSLADLKTEQRETIEKLKEATKFYSTQSILEKYGDVKPEAKEKPKPAQQTPQRPRPAGPPGQPTPEQLRQQAIQKQLAVQVATTGPRGVPGEEIPSSPPIPGAAPVQLPPQLAALQNQPPPLITEVASEPRWYDRILDVLVGEDETSAKARYALICFNCRMVNGLAPPGSKGPDDAGQWGCARCGAMNGKPKEEPRVEEVAEPEEVEEKPRRTKKKRTPRPKTPEETTDDNDNLTPETGDETEEEVVEEPVEVAKESEDEEKTKVRRRKVGKRKA